MQNVTGTSTKTSEKLVTKTNRDTAAAEPAVRLNISKTVADSHQGSNGNSPDKSVWRTPHKSLGNTYVLGLADGGDSATVPSALLSSVSRESSYRGSVSKATVSDDAGITSLSPKKSIDVTSADGTGVNDDSEGSSSGRTWILENAHDRDSIPVVDAEVDEREREEKIAVLSKMLQQTLAVNTARPHTASVNGRVLVKYNNVLIFFAVVS